MHKSMLKHLISQFCTEALLLAGVVSHILQDGWSTVKDNTMYSICMYTTFVCNCMEGYPRRRRQPSVAIPHFEKATSSEVVALLDPKKE